MVHSIQESVENLRLKPSMRSKHSLEMHRKQQLIAQSGDRELWHGSAAIDPALLAAEATRRAKEIGQHGQCRFGIPELEKAVVQSFPVLFFAALGRLCVVLRFVTRWLLCVWQVHGSGFYEEHWNQQANRMVKARLLTLTRIRRGRPHGELIPSLTLTFLLCIAGKKDAIDTKYTLETQKSNHRGASLSPLYTRFLHLISQSSVVDQNLSTI